MRISGAPSIIRKRAAIYNEVDYSSTNLSKKQKKFVSPVPRTGILKQLPSNGSVGIPKGGRCVASLNCKQDSITTTAANISNPGDVATGVIILEEDDDDDGEGKVSNDKNRSQAVFEKQALSGSGHFALKKKARLGVGLIKARFRPPAPAQSLSGPSPRQSDGTSVPPTSAKSSSIASTNPQGCEIPRKTDEQSPTSYYCVMYCTRKLNAKHKGPWSDGVLVCRGRSCTLLDTEGKVVTKDNGHRGGDKSEGAMFPIGKLEVEILTKSTEEAFLSGKIFTGTLDLEADNTINVAHKPRFKSFKRPILKHSRDGTALPLTTPSTHSGPTNLHCLLNDLQKPTSGQRIVTEDSLILNTKEVQRGASPVIVDPYLSSKLRQHQREGVQFMYDCVMGLKNSKFTGCLLADAMGLGKTLQVIALIWTLLHQGPKGRPAVRRVLVICPSSLVENWGKEVRKWLGSERLNALIIHSGTPAKDVKQSISKFQIGKLAPVLVTSYELLRKHNDDLRSAKAELLVCDEAHRLKNCAGNKTIDALLALKCSMKVLLTGTPVQNDLMEFYAMLDFANKDLLGPLSAFKRLFADPIQKSRDRNASDEEKNLGRTRSTELQYRTRSFILQRSADVNLMYLPVKTELIVFCKLRPPQISLYHEFLESKTVETLFLPTSHSAVILSAIGTLRKLCNHPKLVQAELKIDNNQRSCDEFEDYSCQSDDWRLSGKLDCLYKMISAVHADTHPGSRDKIVVVSNFTQTLDIIQTLCEKEKWKWLRLDGTTEVSDRQSKVDRFNSDYSEERVFLLSSKAGGTGLNLIGANRLVLFDPDWNPATDAQAMGRVWRDGQKKPVLIYRLLSTGSIEEKIYQRQIMKQEIAAAVGEQVQGQSGHAGRHFSREELRELFTLRLETRSDTYDLLTKSSARRTERWRDYSDELQDHALESAIKTGTVTFIQKVVGNLDIKIPHCSSSGLDTTSKLSEESMELDICENESSLLSTECPRISPESCQQSLLSNGSLFVSRDLSDLEAPENGDRSVVFDNTCSPSVSTEFEDHEDCRNHPAGVSKRLTDIEKSNYNTEVNNYHQADSPKKSLSVDVNSHDCVPSRADISDTEVECEGRQLEKCRFDRGSSACENDLISEAMCEANRDELTSTRFVETSTNAICQFVDGCSCLLGGKGHKLLHYMLETIGPVGSDFDDLEALDMPFLSSMELEVELERAQFTPQKLWEGFKLFALGFIIGAKQEQIYYSCSTLGLILEKCNGDKTSTVQSVFCKGLPLVRSALSRRHGDGAVELSHLLSVYEDVEQLSNTTNGRYLIELTRRCKSLDHNLAQ
ncbi:hypothetical protein Mapa_016633 [Marchantia paleacea]|nr:hypothetical protein Mapa_016633 [Marchantia paleacea]